MKIISFDVGIKNMAYCTFSIENELLKVQDWNVLNLIQETTEIPKCVYVTKNKQNVTKIYECKFCNKIFSFSQSLSRHYKSCKDKNKIDEANNSMNELVKLLNEQLEKKDKEFKKELKKRDKELEKKDKEFKKEIEKRNKQIDELIKKAGIQNSNNITTNIQNNIKLLAYKDTDISKISDKDIMKCINHSNMCVPHLIKMIHLDPKKPENHNIYISNLKNGFIMTYDGKKWNTLNSDDIIVDMIDDKQNIIEEKIEDWVTKGKQYPELMRKFERYLDKRDNNEILNKIKDEIKLMLYNNRNLIIEKLEE